MAPKVLHVCRSIGGGVGRVVGDLAADQVARGWHVTVACPDGALADQVTALGATHRRWDAARQVGTFARELLPLRAIVRSVQPDVLHLHAAKPGLVGRLVVRGRVPTIYQPHGWSFVLGSRTDALALRWEQFAMRWTAALLCVSHSEADRGAAAGVSSASTVVVPNGVDLQRFGEAVTVGARDRARARLGLGDRPLVLCVGRVCQQKAQDVLLAAWPAVTAAVPTAELVLVGDGPLRSELEAAAVPGVTFVGQRNDVIDWFAAADLVVQPSRWEGLALTVLEAMAAGRSLVVSDADGMVESVGQGDEAAGAVVGIGDVDELGARIVERLHDPRLRDAEGARGRQRVEQGFDQRRVDGDVAALVLRLAQASARR